MMSKILSRRRLLRGAGAGVALPFLDAMVPTGAHARSSRGGKPPTRMAFVYVPNGVHMPDWRPATVGTQFTLPAILDPLKPVRNDVLVMTGLAQDNARPLLDGPGDHARALACFLTGVHPFKTDGANIKVGPSVDQVAAAKLGHLTRLPSLELGCDRGAQSGSCDSGYSCAYSSNLSWKTESLPMAKETNPALVFDRMFGDGVDPRRDRQKLSILDFVREDLQTLQTKLGASDQRKMDQYLTGVRELEGRIARFGTLPPLQAPPFARPDGPPQDPQEHIRLMCDLIVVAFESDVTRIATLLVANAGSTRSYPFLDVPEGHHELSHHGRSPEKQAKLAKINRFHVTQLAYLLQKMKAIHEGDGTLLDHSMVAYGSGISDGDRHNHDDLPILVAGKGSGTISPGRHVRHDKKAPLNNLWLSLLDRMGAPTDALGDADGRLPGLTADL